MRLVILLTMISAVGLAADRIRVERLPVEHGAELITVFESQGAEEEPLVSVLRDTLDHPGAERLRDVWVLTYTRPSLGQKLAASLPFFYSRARAPAIREDRPPAAMLDLSAPERGVVTGLMGVAVQAEFLDGAGVYLRAPTRGYRSDSSEYRSMQVSEALRLLSGVRPETEGQDLLPASDWDEIQARLALSRQMLGGFVSQSHLTGMVERKERLAQVNRGHNWELLRQCAEKNGLYFDPLSFGESTPAYALLWVSETDLASPAKRSFDGSFVKISNPWSDASLRAWKGYKQTWYFDEDGARLGENAAGARAANMIPLAVYSLDYPPAPLLLVDFRNEWKPKRREVIGRAADYTATGLFGLTGYGHWGYMLAKDSWIWLQHRHGANVDRTTRIGAYAELRQGLFFDDTIDPQLRTEIDKRVDHLSLNPFERSEKDEIAAARKQYAALVNFAHQPDGLAKLLDRERGREMVPLAHGPAARGLLTAASIGTFGLYKHREPQTPEMLARLERERELDSNIRFLRNVLASGPEIELVWNRAEITRSLDRIAALKPAGRELDSGLAQMIARVFDQTRDDDTRRHCLSCLASLRSNGSRHELQRVSGDRSVPSELRTLSASYLTTGPAAAGTDD